jgi:hypothetical protein
MILTSDDKLLVSEQGKIVLAAYQPFFIQIEKLAANTASFSLKLSTSRTLHYVVNGSYTFAVPYVANVGKQFTMTVPSATLCSVTIVEEDVYSQIIEFISNNLYNINWLLWAKMVNIELLSISSAISTPQITALPLNHAVKLKSVSLTTCKYYPLASDIPSYVSTLTSFIFIGYDNMTNSYPAQNFDGLGSAPIKIINVTGWGKFQMNLALLQNKNITDMSFVLCNTTNDGYALIGNPNMVNITLRYLPVQVGQNVDITSVVFTGITSVLIESASAHASISQIINGLAYNSIYARKVVTNMYGFYYNAVGDYSDIASSSDIATTFFKIENSNITGNLAILLNKLNNSGVYSGISRIEFSCNAGVDAYIDFDTLNSKFISTYNVLNGSISLIRFKAKGSVASLISSQSQTISLSYLRAFSDGNKVVGLSSLVSNNLGVANWIFTGSDFAASEQFACVHALWINRNNLTNLNTKSLYFNNMVTALDGTYADPTSGTLTTKAQFDALTESDVSAWTSKGKVWVLAHYYNFTTIYL